MKKFLLIFFTVFMVKAVQAKDCVFNVKGECFDCETPYSLRVGTPDNCLKHCPNRISERKGEYTSCDLDENTAVSIYKDTATDGKECDKEGFFSGAFDKCYSCDTTEAVNLSWDYSKEEHLKQCPNRKIHHTSVTAEYSVLKCPEDRPLMDRFFMCWSCDEETPIDLSFNQETNAEFCLNKRYLDGNWSYKCPENKKHLSQSECSTCQGIWYQEKCYNAKDLPKSKQKICAFKSSTYCYTCDDLLSFEVGSWRDCEEYCPNRSYNLEHLESHPSTANCALRECPQNAPLRDKKGSCYSCETQWEYVLDADIQNCEVCPNRYVDQDGNCLLKGQKPLKPAWERYENEPKGAYDTVCPSDKPLKSWNNLCYSCDTQEEIRVDTPCNFDKVKECNAVCKNREIINTAGGNPPSVLKCPEDTPLMDTVGHCWSCDSYENINLQYNEWKCEGICKGKRFLSEENCYKCPSDIRFLSYDACQQCGGKWKGGICFNAHPRGQTNPSVY